MITTTKIAEILDYSESYIYNLIKNLKFSPEVTIKEINYYDPVIIDIIRKSIETKNEQIDKYYHIYIRETFLIFESKINLQT